MKMLPTKVIEVEGEGLITFLDQKVTFFTPTFIFTGKLVGVNDTCVKLENPAIVYETGAFSDKKYKDEQSLCVPFLYLQIGMIITFFASK